jgi:hypothetical protein
VAGFKAHPKSAELVNTSTVNIIYSTTAFVD